MLDIKRLLRESSFPRSEENLSRDTHFITAKELNNRHQKSRAEMEPVQNVTQKAVRNEIREIRDIE